MTVDQATYLRGMLRGLEAVRNGTPLDELAAAYPGWRDTPDKEKLKIGDQINALFSRCKTAELLNKQ